MGNILYTFSRVNQLGSRNDDDFSDRLSHRYTTILLTVFSILVTGKQYTGDPIHCWCPAAFSDAQVNYANSLCWIKNTYYIPIGDLLPLEDEPRRSKEISYYQWVPIVLLGQACLFYLPCLVWRILNSRSGINVNNIVRTVSDSDHVNPDIRERTIKYLVRHMDRCFENQREYRTGWCIKVRQFIATKMCLLCGRRYGNFLIASYLLVKLLYFLNALGQLFLMNAFLKTEYMLYGYEVLRDLAKMDDWTASIRFPRVTLCDFKIRMFGHNVHRYTVQCVLPINLFNEKIYIFLWFWFVVIACSAFYTFMSTLMIAIAGNRIRYIKKYLKLMGRYDKETEKKVIGKFVNLYLKQDGVFVVRLLSKNTNDVFVSEIICGLWTFYKNYRRTGAEVAMV
ncbi:unnamed protein product [Owenia fusiformis]|uniref:Innexin n=1 Tax=Owenia fusiformis TaxID=6347 RepID=A0A8J1TLM1_OWEFU|nr:unnamed protein product [Owenia fusiformis]